MDKTLEVSKIASKAVEEYLKNLKETVSVINVEDDKRFQKQDVDLLWVYILNNKEYFKKIEVKGDRYSHTGNFFIETMSNIERNNPGCFMYTEADFIYYYFIDTKEVNIIPVKRWREWFISNKERFTRKKLSTAVGNGARYTSEGRLVPKVLMRKEVGIKYKKIA
jgi:hypothetical protein